MKKINKGISKRINQLRDRLGLSQEGFGKRIGVTQQYVGAMETGIRKPSHSLIFMMAKKLRVSEEWLATGKGTAPKF